MRITTKNYFNTVKQIGIENLPLVLKESHTAIIAKTDHGNDWTLYKTNKDLKAMVDLAFQKIEEYQKSKGDLSGLKGTDSAEVKRAKADAKNYHKISTEKLKMILRLENDVEMEEGLLPEVEIRKSAIEKILKERGEKMEGSSENKKASAKTNPYSVIDKEVYYIGWFLEFHDTILSKKKLGIFIDELQRSMEKKEITKKSPVASNILSMQNAAVAKYNKMINATHFVLQSATIKKLKGIIAKHENLKEDTSIIKPESKKKTIALNGIIPSPQVNVMSSKEFASLQFDTIGFRDKWLDFIGDPAPGFTAMVFGMPKMGKSYLCVDFAGYLARNHGKVLYVAKEEKLDATLQQKLKDKQVAHENLDVADALPKDLSDYNFIFLDSVNKIGLTPKDLEKLKAENKGKSFIYIFQATKGGKFKGNNEFQHDVDIVIEVPEKGKAVQFGRFNQGGAMDIFSESTSDSLPAAENVSMLAGIKKKAMKDKYPDWTTPKHMNPADHHALKYIYDLYKAGKLHEAMDYASHNADTAIREEIPSEIWKEMGGQITKSGEDSIKARKLNEEIQIQITKITEIVNTLSKNKDANWGDVAGLANLHSSLGERMNDGYKEHHGYSSSVKEGMKRHSDTTKKLLKELSKMMIEFSKKKYVAELIDWKEYLIELVKSYPGVKKNIPYKGKDYSDDLRALKSLHEDNIGRKFTDDQFNEIFSLALLKNKSMEKHAIELNNGVMGFLMTMDQATDEWDESRR